jgi:acyl-CoA reductase-like NAD-dependent aldehyde dehydrogenase
MSTFKVITVAMKARRGWSRLPPEQRRAILAAAGSSARKHGPTVARAVKEQGPTVARAVKDQGPTFAKSLARALRESRKTP